MIRVNKKAPFLHLCTYIFFRLSAAGPAWPYLSIYSFNRPPPMEGGANKYLQPCTVGHSPQEGRTWENEIPPSHIRDNMGEFLGVSD